jgi:adenine-specific DNA-methyltransferase
MPILDWIGKDKVINHHLDVPYCVLNRKYSFDESGIHEEDNGSDNKIIHGDNLLALKSLLPQYEGRIKCIYIDPPYNTGNEGWIYNDNVNDPKISKWLGDVVGKEGEDLSRHDKWLCMMYPRLRLLEKLLSNDGVIFISIDDNEQANLKLICDEIFGPSNFIAQAVWKRRASSALAYRNISIDHEYVLIYGKSETGSFYGVDKDYKGYSNPDNDPRGPWTTGDLTVGMTAEMRPNQFYDLVDPKTGNVFKPSASRVWSYIPESMDVLIKENRIVFPDSTDKRPMKKRFLSELKSNTNPMSTWMTEVGLNTEGAKTIKQIFGEAVFPYSKPTSLIEYLASQVLGKDDVMLDSFAGSGTTAQAILSLNRKDNGNRKFLLIEMLDYAEDVTSNRVRKIITGYNGEEGLGGSFSFYELGEPLMENGLLNSSVSIEKIREYVFFTETKQKVIVYKSDEPYLLGTYLGNAYYFYYDRDNPTTLDRDFLHTIKTKSERYIIYADLCTLSERELEKYSIVFKKIPRDISKL